MDGLVVDPRAGCPPLGLGHVRARSQEADRVLPVVARDRHELVRNSGLLRPRRADVARGDSPDEFKASRPTAHWHVDSDSALLG